MKRPLPQIRSFLIVLCVLSFVGMVQAQQIITGKVTAGENGEGIPGASVIVKGSSIGTTTDAKGDYSLDVASGNTLVFSFIGYTSQEVIVGQMTVVDVTLVLSTHELDEIIVVGYSEKKKSEITGAVTNLSAEKLKGVTGSSLEYQLQGKTAGVQVTTASGEPGAPAEIRIRGNSSITVDTGPLFVVDGIPGGTYNPNDVESITVLKDAGAVALYGSHANAGVIIVTTKHGNSEKPVVTYSTTMGTRNITTGNFKLMNSQELYETERLMFPGSAAFLSYRPANLLDNNTDWLGLAYKQGVIQNHNLSVRGKSGKVGYYLAGDYYDEQGTLLTTKYKRFNFRSNLDFELAKGVKLTTNLNIMRDNRSSYHWRWPYQPFLYLPYDTPYDADGNIRYIDATTPGFLTRDKNNILQSAQYNDYLTHGLSLNGDAILTADVTPWLTVQSRNRFSYSSYRSDSYEDVRTIEGAANSGVLSFGVSDGYQIISTNLLRAHKDFGLHQLGGFVGFEGTVAESNTAGGTGYGLVSGIKIPGGIASPQGISGTKDRSTAQSILSEVNYNYNERYFLSLSLRRDGSSIFGANRRWGNFGAVSASWIISKESFFAGPSKSITFLKLRGSHGILGNDAIGTFRYLAKYNFSTQYNGGSAGYPETLPNPNLGWEQTKSSDVGLDITLFDRIDVTLDAFYKDTDRLLFGVPLPTSQGIDLLYKNAGRVITKGLELDISGDIIHNNNITWNAGFNISTAQNRAKSLSDGLQFLPKTYDGTKQAIFAGHDVNSWYLPKWEGVDPNNGDPLWQYTTLDGNGAPNGTGVTNKYALASSSTSLQLVGSATPKFYGGFNTSVSYMRFTLSVSSAFTYGNKLYHRTREFIDADGGNFNFNMMKLADGWSRWQNPGDQATHPKPVYGGNQQSNKPSSRYLEDGSFWRLRNVTLRYAVPTSVLSKLHLSNASIFVSGDNLFTWTKFSGLDPDAGQFGVAGMSDFKYPISKQYLAGVQISF